MMPEITIPPFDCSPLLGTLLPKKSSDLAGKELDAANGVALSLPAGRDISDFAQRPIVVKDHGPDYLDKYFRTQNHQYPKIFENIALITINEVGFSFSELIKAKEVLEYSNNLIGGGGSLDYWEHADIGIAIGYTRNAAKGLSDEQGNMKYERLTVNMLREKIAEVEGNKAANSVARAAPHASVAERPEQTVQDIRMDYAKNALAERIMLFDLPQKQGEDFDPEEFKLSNKAHLHQNGGKGFLDKLSIALDELGRKIDLINAMTQKTQEQ